MKDLFDLKGKVAVVAGASSGLGADAARAYAEYGAQVALLARRKERLDELAEEVTAAGGTAFAAACDVTVEERKRMRWSRFLRIMEKLIFS